MTANHPKLRSSGRSKRGSVASLSAHVGTPHRHHGHFAAVRPGEESLTPLGKRTTSMRFNCSCGAQQDRPMSHVANGPVQLTATGSRLSARTPVCNNPGQTSWVGLVRGHSGQRAGRRLSCWLDSKNTDRSQFFESALGRGEPSLDAYSRICRW